MLCIGKTPVNLHLKKPLENIRAKPVLEVPESKEVLRSKSGFSRGIVQPASVNTVAGNYGLEATRGRRDYGIGVRLEPEEDDHSGNGICSV